MREQTVRWIAPALALALGGCRASGADRLTAADAGEPAWPGLTIDLTPDPGASEVRIELRVQGPLAAAVKELAVARTWAETRGAGAVGPVSAADGEGELPLRDGADGDADRVLVLDRAPRGGELVVRYRARANGDTSRFGLRVRRDRLSGVGHAFLLLPRLEGRVPVRIRWHAAGLAPGVMGASSFGVGDEITTMATGEELGQAAYLAGPAHLEEPLSADAGAPPLGENERLLVVGAPAFDTRAAFYWAVTAAGTAQRFFDPSSVNDHDDGPFAFLLIAEPGLGRDHDAAALTRSFALWYDAARGFDGGLKSVVAHELTHRWIGGAVRLVDGEGREAIWFSEGFTVHLGRRWLVESGMVTPRDVVEDLDRTAGEPAPSGRSAAACASERRGRTQEEYRRGARYAAVTDAAIRRASQGQRGLEDVVRALLARARREGRPELPIAAFREAVVGELGEAGGEDFDRCIVHGEPVSLAPDTFGPCFRRVEADEEVFSLGFDRRSLARTPGAAFGVVAGSAAEKAGLRDGALLLSARVPSIDEGAPLPEHREVELTVAGKNGSRRVRYRPAAKRHVVKWEAQACKPGGNRPPPR